MAIERRGWLCGMLMLTVLLFNITATTLFVHSHIIDGETIVHSHPYSGPVTSHSHTTSHLQLINDTSHHLSLIVEDATHANAPLATIATQYDIYSCHIAESECHIVSLRAPPTLV